MTVLTNDLRRNLSSAVQRDDTLGTDDRARILWALDSLSTGDELLDDITDLEDGTTDIEIVTIAIDFYGLDR